jgi:hypothetical protein
MKNLDNSLLCSANLDESISNADGSGAWADAVAASIALTNQVIQTRNTPKNEIEQVCDVKPLFKGAKKDAWDKCAENFRNRASSTSPTTFTSPAIEQKTTNWWLVGGSIFGGLAVLGSVAYFIFRKK